MILFGSCAISGGNSPYIAAIDAETGSVLHQTDQPFRQSYNVWGYNVLWRDGAAWFAGAFTNVWRYEPPSYTNIGWKTGVTVAALDPATGEVRWKKHLAKRPSKVPPGGRDARVVAYSFINSVPRIADGQIVLGDGGRKGGYFAFRPEDAERELNERLASPPEKKR